jgi:hypothetical protein
MLVELLGWTVIVGSPRLRVWRGVRTCIPSQHFPIDIWAQSDLQPFVATAPLNLIYVARGVRKQHEAADDRRLYAPVDAGFIAQNVYLFCASEGARDSFSR